MVHDAMLPRIRRLSFEDGLTNSLSVTSLDTMLSYSEWSRPAKLSQAACRLLKVGGDRVSAEGWTGVLGRPHARAPKVPPKTVGPRRGEWFLGEPAGGGLTTLQCQRTAACFKHGGGKPEWGSPQNACILWGPRVGGGSQHITPRTNSLFKASPSAAAPPCRVRKIFALPCPLECKVLS